MPTIVRSSAPSVKPAPVHEPRRMTARTPRRPTTGRDATSNPFFSWKLDHTLFPPSVCETCGDGKASHMRDQPVYSLRVGRLRGIKRLT